MSSTILRDLNLQCSSLLYLSPKFSLVQRQFFDTNHILWNYLVFYFVTINFLFSKSYLVIFSFKVPVERISELYSFMSHALLTLHYVILH